MRKRILFQNKAYFQHDMTHGDFKDLPIITASDKIFWARAFNVGNPNHDGYQRGIDKFLITILLRTLKQNQ